MNTVNYAGCHVN